MKSYKIGMRLRQEREKLGMSIEEVGFICEISRNHIGQIERGEKTPRIDTAEKIANALNLEIEELFSNIEPDKKPEYIDYIQPYINTLTQTQFEFVLSNLKSYVKHIKDETKS